MTCSVLKLGHRERFTLLGFSITTDCTMLLLIRPSWGRSGITRASWLGVPEAVAE